MYILIIIFALLLFSFYLQYLFSRLGKKKESFILMIVVLVISLAFLIMNYLDAFTDFSGFEDFLYHYGTNGAFALFVKTKFVLVPTFIHFLIYLLTKSKTE